MGLDNWRVSIRDDIELTGCGVFFDGRGELRILTPDSTPDELLEKLKLLPWSSDRRFRIRVEVPSVVEATFHQCHLVNVGPAHSNQYSGPVPMVFMFNYQH